MKKKFSPAWKSSSQVRKQRKYVYNAPFHVKQKLVSAHLSKELRKKHGIRALSLMAGDEVIVQRGNFKKRKAKVTEVDLLKKRVTLENFTRQKKDGSKIPVFFDASNLLLISITGEDKKRLKPTKKEDKNASDKISSK